jgi:hypothetical protein
MLVLRSGLLIYNTYNGYGFGASRRSQASGTICAR